VDWVALAVAVRGNQANLFLGCAWRWHSTTTLLSSGLILPSVGLGGRSIPEHHHATCLTYHQHQRHQALLGNTLPEIAGRSGIIKSGDASGYQPDAAK
jgi:hypothetical protein